MFLARLFLVRNYYIYLIAVTYNHFVLSSSMCNDVHSRCSPWWLRFYGLYMPLWKLGIHRQRPDMRGIHLHRRRPHQCRDFYHGRLWCCWRHFSADTDSYRQVSSAAPLNAHGCGWTVINLIGLYGVWRSVILVVLHVHCEYCLLPLNCLCVKRLRVIPAIVH